MNSRRVTNISSRTKLRSRTRSNRRKRLNSRTRSRCRIRIRSRTCSSGTSTGSRIGNTSCNGAHDHQLSPASSFLLQTESLVQASFSYTEIVTAAYSLLAQAQRGTSGRLVYNVNMVYCEVYNGTLLFYKQIDVWSNIDYEYNIYRIEQSYEFFEPCINCNIKHLML